MNCPVCNNILENGKQKVCTKPFDKDDIMDVIYEKFKKFPIEDKLFHVTWIYDDGTMGLSYFTNYPKIKEYRFVKLHNKVCIYENFSTDKITHYLDVSLFELFFKIKTFDEIESIFNKLAIFENNSKFQKIENE